MTLSRLRSCSHCPVKFVHQRVGARIRDHAPHLRLEHARRAQPAGDRQVQQLVVRNAAPQEERQPARQLEIADPMRRADRRRLAGSCSERNRNDGLVRIRARPARMPASKSPPAVALLAVERQRRVDVRLHDRPPERAARHSGEDLRRRKALPARRAVRRADEQPLTRRRVSPTPVTCTDPR